MILIKTPGRQAGSLTQLWSHFPKDYEYTDWVWKAACYVLRTGNAWGLVFSLTDPWSVVPQYPRPQQASLLSQTLTQDVLASHLTRDINIFL